MLSDVSPFRGLEVRLLVGRQAAETSADLGVAVYLAVLNGMEDDPHPGRYQLECVGVAGENHRFDLLLLGGPGQCPNDVVALETLLFEYGYFECPHQFFHAVELVAKLRRSGRPVGLVFREPQASECRRGQVERYGAVGGRPFLDRPERRHWRTRRRR